MRITVNGEQEEAPDGITLLDFIISRGLDPQAVVAELDRDIITADNFAQVRLAQGNTLELLQFVGGG